MIGRLLYLTTSRPYVKKMVGLVARFQAYPREIHVLILKRIFKYLQGTTYYGLWYARIKEFKLSSYTNVDWEGSIYDRKRTSGATLFLGNFLVSWVNKKQVSISFLTSTIHLPTMTI